MAVMKIATNKLADGPWLRKCLGFIIVSYICTAASLHKQVQSVPPFDF